MPAASATLDWVTPPLPQSRMVSLHDALPILGVGPVPLTVARSCTVVPAVVVTPTGALLASRISVLTSGVSRGFGLSATSWATQSAAAPAVAVLFPVGPGAVCATSAASEVVLVVAASIVDDTW